MGSTGSIRDQDDKGHYAYYPLKTESGYDLLPTGYEMVVNKVSGRVTLLNWNRRRVVTECSFSDQELPLIIALLNAWPSFAPYEHMLALTSDEPAYSIAQRVEETRDTDALDTLLSPVRTILKECQERVNMLGIKIAAVLDTGFLLIALSRTERPSSLT